MARPGYFTLSVVFKQQKYDIDDWEDTGSTDIQKISFTVVRAYETKYETNLYEEPALSEIIENIPSGEEVTVLQHGDVWSQVQYKDIEGYMLTKSLEEVE
jgi:uncharacterized protein YgiM (DUF1202 family)